MFHQLLAELTFPMGIIPLQAQVKPHKNRGLTTNAVTLSIAKRFKFKWELEASNMNELRNYKTMAERRQATYLALVKHSWIPFHFDQVQDFGHVGQHLLGLNY